MPLGKEAPDLESSKAQEALHSMREAIRERLPAKASDVFAWLLQQPREAVLELLAWCVGQTVYAVHATEGSDDANALARAVGLDMTRWWSPTVDAYLGSIRKTQILDVVRTAVCGEAASSMARLSEADLAQAAEHRRVNTRWLPAPSVTSCP